MDMEGALRARLLAALPVTALVDQRVYWEERPQGTSFPAIVLDEISDVRAQTLKDFDLPFARVQVRVMGRSFAEKKAMKEAVVAALVPAELINGIQFMRATEVSAVPRNERTATEMIFVDAVDFELRWKVVG